MNIINNKILTLQTTTTQDTVNNDINLQLFVTKFYYNKTKKWIKSDSSFFNFSDKNFKSKKGKIFIHKILTYIVSKYNINWYDLRSYCTNIKLFIKKKLKNF